MVLLPAQKSVVKHLLKAEGLVDVIIPRGGQGLINFVRRNSLVPVIETGAGVCHTYVEASADLKVAADIVFNAKTYRPSVCNALDTLVLDQKIAQEFLPLVAKKLATKDVVIYADNLSYQVLKQVYIQKLLKKAKASDFGREFLSLQMSVKTVKGFDQAVDFVQTNTSGHSETIITNNKKLAEKYLQIIDAAAVYHNASTPFTDVFQFGDHAAFDDVPENPSVLRDPLG